MPIGILVNRFIQGLIGFGIFQIKRYIFIALCVAVYVGMYASGAGHVTIKIVTILMGVGLMAYILWMMSHKSDPAIFASAMVSFVIVLFHFTFIDFDWSNVLLWFIMLVGPPSLALVIYYDFRGDFDEQKQDPLENKQEQPINDLPPKQ
jgi:hypothetical protein